MLFFDSEIEKNVAIMLLRFQSSRWLMGTSFTIWLSVIASWVNAKTVDFIRAFHEGVQKSLVVLIFLLFFVYATVSWCQYLAKVEFIWRKWIKLEAHVSSLKFEVEQHFSQTVKRSTFDGNWINTLYLDSKHYCSIAKPKKLSIFIKISVWHLILWFSFYLCTKTLGKIQNEMEWNERGNV